MRSQNMYVGGDQAPRRRSVDARRLHATCARGPGVTTGFGMSVCRRVAGLRAAGHHSACETFGPVREQRWGGV